MEITCINCPVGCRLQVTLNNGEVTAVVGNSCKRGEIYAKQECVAPTRMITASVAIGNRKIPLSVKTRTPVPKAKIFDCMAALGRLKLEAPIRAGQTICPDICGTGVDVIATRTVE